MAKFYDVKISQSTGEITPLLAARSDLAAYNNGAKEITNCLVLPQGSFINRPGTRLLGQGFTGCRLIPFVVNTDIAFVLVFYPDSGNSRIEVWTKDGLITTVKNPNSSVNATHGYADSELQDVRFVQSVDLLFLFHKNRVPEMLTRKSVTSWELEEFVMKRGPYQDMNTDASKTVTFSWNSSMKKGTITCNRPIFNPGMVGMLFLYEFWQDAQSFSVPTDLANGVSRTDLYGPISIKSEAKIVGTVAIQRRGPNEASYSTVANMEMMSGSAFYTEFGYSTDETEIGASYVFQGVPTGDGLKVSSSGGIAQYQFEITGYTDTFNVTVTSDAPDINAVMASRSTPTSNWALGSFGGGRGYPALATFHQERLVLANSIAEPTSIWMSQPTKWDFFDTTIPSEDSDAISIILASDQANEVRALSSREDLLIFTAGTEFVAQTGSQSDVFTPSSLVVVPTGYRGCWDLDTLDIGPTTMFVQKHGNVIRGMGYKLEQDGYDTSELSILSQHFFEGKQVIRWGYQQDPWSIVWIVLSDGSVLAFTFMQEHTVAAWTQQEFQFEIKDLCVIPGDTQDDVFMIGEDCLLMLKHRLDKENLWTNDMFLDDIPTGQVPYTSVYESLELEQAQAQGTLQGRFKHVPRITLRLFRTCALSAGIMTENSDKVDEIVFPSDLEPIVREVPYTGDVHVTVPGDTGRNCRLKISNSYPVPFTVLGIWREVTMHDDNTQG